MSWIFAALLSAVFASLVAIFGKIGLQGVDSTLATTIRSVIMAGFLMGVSAVLGKFKLLGVFNGKVMLAIVLSGIAGALSWIFYFFALKKGPPAGVAALDRLSVVFVFILAVLFFGQRFDLRSAFGALLVLAGAILLI